LSASDKEIHELVRQEAGDCLQRMEANLLALESGEGGEEEAVDAILRDAHSIKGSSAMIGWQGAASLASAIEDCMERAREARSFRPELADPLLRSVDALRRAIDGEEGEAPPLAAELAALLAADDEQGGGAQSRERPAGEGAEIAAGSVRAPTIRIDAAKVDRMLDAVGETVLYHRRLEHSLGDTLHDGRQVSDELDMGERLLGDLRDSVVQMRTLPLSMITSPFPRAIRDLA
jgi:two-component system, chemotaxis family, sensor kinase CheA